MTVGQSTRAAPAAGTLIAIIAIVSLRLPATEPAAEIGGPFVARRAKE